MSDTDQKLSSEHVETRGLFIDGREVAANSRELLDVRNPANGQVIARTAHADAADVDKAVRSARAAFQGKAWGGMDTRTRAKLINKLADAFDSHMEELYHLETMNNGRPLKETRAQLRRLPDFFRYNAGLALSRRDAVIPVEGDYLNYTQRRPLGVVGNCTPFNHPLMIMCKSLAPVLASGCTTVVKPSEYTPLTSLALARIFTEAGLPDGVFNIVTGLGATSGKALCEHRDLNKIVLTGGTEAGQIAGANAGRNFSHQTLELGGKTPVLVFPDFEIERAVNYAAFGAFVGGGQTCICGSRHIVHRDIYNEFVDKLAAKANAIRIGDPGLMETQLGPVISEKQRNRVLSYVKYGIDEGARLVAGGEVPPHLAGSGGYFVQPTVFVDVTPSMRVFQEEVFGPFTSVTPFSTEEEAIALANNSPYGLAGAIRTNDLARAHRVAAALDCGIVWINDHHRLDPASPWGGVKLSGIGRESGTESFDDHFEVKSIMVNTSGKPFDWYENTTDQSRLN
jgi:acyl-CoA reductase-like NAD-dependent aldehyde dehydrogenase